MAAVVLDDVAGALSADAPPRLSVLAVPQEQYGLTTFFSTSQFLMSMSMYDFSYGPEEGIAVTWAPGGWPTVVETDDPAPPPRRF